MSVTKHRTPYGDAWVAADHVAIAAHGGQLYQWAHRPGAVWPCSVLDDLDGIRAEFDSNGLLDLVTPSDSEDLSADELNAWSSDVLRDVLPTDHPAYFVAVGQFEEN